MLGLSSILTLGLVMEVTLHAEVCIIASSLEMKVGRIWVTETGEMFVSGGIRYNLSDERLGEDTPLNLIEMTGRSDSNPFSVSNASSMQVSGVPETLVRSERLCFGCGLAPPFRHLLSNGESLPFHLSLNDVLDGEKIRTLSTDDLAEIKKSIQLNCKLSIDFVSYFETLNGTRVGDVVRRPGLLCPQYYIMIRSDVSD